MSSKSMDVDEILTQIGGYGYFQKRQTLILGLVIFVLTFQPLIMVFIGAEVPWRCTSNSTCRHNGTIEPTNSHYEDRCKLNRTDWQYVDKFTSITSEWDLICGREVYASLSQSILFIGWIPGAFLIGRLSDRFGRTKVLFPAAAVVAVSALASSFTHVLWLFLLLRATIGFFQGGTFVILYVLSTEFVGPEHRSLAGTLNWVFFCVSLMVLDGLAYGIRNWRHLSIATSAPALPLILLWWWVPESSRWNLLHNKEKEARKTFAMIAKLNNKSLEIDHLADNNIEEKNDEEPGGIIDLFRPKQQLMKTVILWVAWFTNSMVYYGVTLSSGALGGSLYLNFFLTSLVELPANFFAIWFMDQYKCKLFGLFGRKRALVLGLVLASIFCVVVSVVPQTEGNIGFQAIKILAAVLGKFSISISFCTIYVASVEVLPTIIRNVGLGSMAAFDQFGASIAPFVVLLNKTHPVLPFVLMALTAFVAGFLSWLVLPETLGQHTLETLADRNSEDKQAGLAQETETMDYQF
ncbi:solute carrier family 22 member 15 [Exaiptasia diaphana]|uniref:Major facilitator superfamily (MFS) profile domain-containing protein n=1 Tax=Exaiptasia diaphana TaxID=2652724 RepID=A0A913WS15_EXADI|nr:solute carrier family 22 member 15 [Exaiptasia diaphana]KXJ27984.1 Solute carrier family 22 member 15 [Exaiptasia diaphana]